MTELLIWRDEYLIGVEELDYEHKDMFGRLNELHEELQQYDNRDNIERCLGEIYSRYLSHFALEEHYMLNNDIPNYREHKKEHDEFLEDLMNRIDSFVASPDLDFGDELAELLQSWTVRHLTGSDREIIKSE